MQEAHGLDAEVILARATHVLGGAEKSEEGRTIPLEGLWPPQSPLLQSACAALLLLRALHVLCQSDPVHYTHTLKQKTKRMYKINTYLKASAVKLALASYLSQASFLCISTFICFCLYLKQTKEEV